MQKFEVDYRETNITQEKDFNTLIPLNPTVFSG